MLQAPLARAGSTIKSDEEVMFFTTAAHRQGQRWIVPVHGWIFEPEEHSVWRGGLLAGLRASLHIGARDPGRARFERRARWFLVDNERGKTLTVRAAGHETRMSSSKPNGHFRGELKVSGWPSARALEIRAKTRRGDRRAFKGRALLVPPKGLSVISDIDDTIKITDVLDHRRTLERTFLEEFEAVDGMAKLYETWQRRGAVFHYVSASPWHLYRPLTSFMKRAGFPEGTVHLRNFRLKDSSRWNLFESSAPHKLGTIRDLMRRFPKRRFFLVGDTSEGDPEIYARIAREHPAQVEAIYLRTPKASRWSAKRHRKAFAGVRARVLVFASPSEI
jgi:phosphatidate phosphatase APP1